MKIINKVCNFITRPKKLLGIVLNHIAPLIKDDALFIRMKWKLRMDYPLNLDNPKTYNEKLQWLKLHDHNPLYTTMVDKYEAKKYVEKIVGEEHIIPTLDVYDRVEDIDFDKLPSQFVLKWTHDSGGLVICKDKSQLNVSAAYKKLKKGERSHYFWRSREWPYKNVKPRIIAEQYMEDESGYELKDYKFFCFDGEPKALFIATDRGKTDEETKFDFYDMDFNHLPFTNGHPNATREIKKPAGFEEMKRIASQLSRGIPHVRVDLYNINGKIYFGEITFFHWGGMKIFNPREWDYIFGEWIKLPQ